ncbi:hypothetical protein SNE40_005182 [Patella caerulea]|uniref:Uncharacterized protein n=1 Tax=Patella caerulea TaxID=87958 RepID=A0AAN8JZL7_PATCE
MSNELQKSLEFERNRVDEALEEISKKNAELEEKLILLEKHDRKYNILIYGVEKKQNKDISKVVYNFFAEQLELDEEILLSVRFANLHRLRSYENDKRGPPAILVKFIHYHDRDLIMGNSYKLQSGFRILSDLPVVMKKERSRLATIAYKLRKENYLKT